MQINAELSESQKCKLMVISLIHAKNADTCFSLSLSVCRYGDTSAAQAQADT
jgi:hypothetical protein